MMTLDLQALARGDVTSLLRHMVTRPVPGGGHATLIDLTEPLTDRAAKFSISHPETRPGTKVQSEIAGWALQQIRFAVERAIHRKG